MQHLALGSGAEKFKEANIVDNTVRPELSKMGVMNPRRVFKLKSSSTPAAPAPVEPTPAAPAPVESAPKKVFKLKKSEVKEPEVSGKDRLLAEVKKNAADVLSYAKSGASSSDVLKRWNSSVGPKLNLYGAEYLPYGAASEMSDEMFEKIQEVLSATKKKEAEDYDRKYKEGRDEIVKYAKEFGMKRLDNIISEAETASLEGKKFRSRENWKGKASYKKKIDAIWDSYTGPVDTFYAKIPSWLDWKPKGNRGQSHASKMHKKHGINID